MSKESILTEIKNELMAKIQTMNFNNYQEKQREINHFFELIKLLDELPFENVIYQEQKIIPLPLNHEDFSHSKPNLDLTQGNSNREDGSFVGNVYRFERKLRGGFVPDLNDGYMIPEKMVRDMEVEDGDLIRVTSEREYMGQKFYYFELAERGSGPNPNRVEHRYCPVEKEAGYFVVKESQGKNIKLDETPFTFLLKDSDVQHFNIEEGDIIDIAYYKNNPAGTVKIIFKYETEEELLPTIEQKRLNSSTKNEKIKNTEETDCKYPINLELLQGKRVLIVGGENRHADYENAFQRLGIELETMQGMEGEKRLEAAIQRADAVVIVTGEIRHAGSISTVKFCKKYGIPFDDTYENGIQSVLLCAEKALSKSQLKVEETA